MSGTGGGHRQEASQRGGESNGRFNSPASPGRLTWPFHPALHPSLYNLSPLTFLPLLTSLQLSHCPNSLPPSLNLLNCSNPVVASLACLAHLSPLRHSSQTSPFTFNPLPLCFSSFPLRLFPTCLLFCILFASKGFLFPTQGAPKALRDSGHPGQGWAGLWTSGLGRNVGAGELFRPAQEG